MQQHLITHLNTIVNYWHLAKLQTPSDSFKQATVIEKTTRRTQYKGTSHQQEKDAHLLRIENIYTNSTLKPQS
jgi:hypothetical protein